MKLLLIGFLLVCTRFSGEAQDISLMSLYPQDTINLVCTSLITNTKDQLYVITEQNEVLLLDTSGLILKRYSNNYLGTPQFIYYQNPLQLVLFYPAFQTIIILDHSFNELTRIALSSLDISYVNTIGLTANREIIYFDTNTQLFQRTNYVTKINQSFIGFPTESIGQIKVILTRKNEFKALTENEFISWDAAGFDIADAYGQIVDWNEASILFYNSDSQEVINVTGKISSRTKLPESFKNIKRIGLLTEGLAATDQAGRIILFRARR